MFHYKKMSSNVLPSIMDIKTLMSMAFTSFYTHFKLSEQFLHAIEYGIVNAFGLGGFAKRLLLLIIDAAAEQV